MGGGRRGSVGRCLGHLAPRLDAWSPSGKDARPWSSVPTVDASPVAQTVTGDGATLVSDHPARESLEDVFVRAGGGRELAAYGRATRMSTVFRIAVNVFRELVRDKVLYNLVGFAILMIGVSLLIGQLTAGQEVKIIKDLGLASVSVFGTFIAIFIGIGLVSKEVEKRSIYALIAKPLSAVEPLVLVIEECLLGGVAITRRLVTVVVTRQHEGRVIEAERHLGVTVSPVSAHDGSPQGVICLFTDLTKVMALEEQVRLKDGLALLGELTAGLAHELRNGLATVHGYARLLDPATLPARQAGYVAALREETESLNQLVTNFLNFARPVNLTPVDIEVSQVVTRVRDEFADDVTAHGGALTVTGHFGRVSADELLLRQALDNLCRNAIEACTQHGVPPIVVFEGEVDSASLHQVIRVVDSGPGIDPLRIDKIFQPFFTTKTTGTGLGLAVAQKIVVTHNGRLTAFNGVEGGAVFEIRLPLAEGSLTTFPPLHVA